MANTFHGKSRPSPNQKKGKSGKGKGGGKFTREQEKLLYARGICGK